MTQRTIGTIADTIAAFEPVALMAAADQHTTIRKLVTDAVDL